MRKRRGTGAPPAAPALPPELRQLDESVPQALTLKMRLEDSVDIAPVLRGRLDGFSPETRVGLANTLPGPARRPTVLVLRPTRCPAPEFGPDA
jgi:hypothetical protein